MDTVNPDLLDKTTFGWRKHQF